MKFSALVEQVSELLQRQQRISYRALKREFDLDDEDVEDLKAELIDAKRLASDEEGKVLVWSGEELQGRNGESGKRRIGERQSRVYVQRPESKDQSLTPSPSP